MDSEDVEAWCCRTPVAQPGTSETTHDVGGKLKNQLDSPAKLFDVKEPTTLNSKGTCQKQVEWNVRYS